jgi:hypothetical protein
MEYPCPPSAKPEAWMAELSTISKRHRDDAVQEAWVAHLEGRNPIQAMSTWSWREKRRERRAGIEVDSESGDTLIVGDTPTTDETHIKPRERRLIRKPQISRRAA